MSISVPSPGPDIQVVFGPGPRPGSWIKQHKVTPNFDSSQQTRQIAFI